MTDKAQPICACGTCSCAVQPGKSIEKDGRLYCSQGCAEGRGCGACGCRG
ncbi:MAG: metallothionein [Pseudomonadota bacterium]